MDFSLYDIPVLNEQVSIFVTPTFKVFDSSKSQQFKAVIKNSIYNSPKRFLVVDFSNICQADNICIAELFKAWHLCNDQNVSLILCNLNQKFLNLCKKKGLDSFITICENKNDAILLTNKLSEVNNTHFKNTKKLENFFGMVIDRKELSIKTVNIEKNDFSIYKLNYGKQLNTVQSSVKYENNNKQECESNKTFISLIYNNDNMALQLVEALTENGYYIKRFTSIDNNIDRIISTNTHIVISDISTSNFKEIELCEKIKTRNNNIHFIFLTSKTDIGTRLKAFKSGADDFIACPHDERELLARLKTAEKKLWTISDLITRQQNLEKLVVTDPLTKLNNRRYFENQLIKELDRAKRYDKTMALILIDIDHFKQINDSYGHLIGNQVLQRVSSLLINSTRDSDIICRIGGEEFVIILPETLSEKAFIVAEKIRELFQKTTFLFNNIKIRLTISLGIAIKSPDMELETDELFDMADKALYLAKQNGRNRTIIYDLKKNFQFMPAKMTDNKTSS